MNGDPPAVLDMLVPAASRLIGRVLDAVHEDLSKLLTADDLQLDFVMAARPHFSGKDEAAELQVLFCSSVCVTLERCHGFQPVRIRPSGTSSFGLA